jgi:hypothetical protein
MPQFDFVRGGGMVRWGCWCVFYWCAGFCYCCCLLAAGVRVLLVFAAWFFCF